jgi:hypothetical protein
MKIQRFSEFQSKIQFPNFQNYRQIYFDSFLSTDLGKIYQALPWNRLVDGFELKEHKKGPRSIFSPRGKIALMFLKHTAGVSDKKLIDQLNANIDYQIFCDLVIPPGARIKNYKIVSEIRCALSKLLDEQRIQKILAEEWRGYCANKDSITCDATCYESYIRYPTDVKLLYEAVRWNYDRLWVLRRIKKKRMIRSKMKKWKAKYQSYSKSKKPSRKSTRSVTRGLLRLLEKIHNVLLEEERGLKMDQNYWQRRKTTGKVVNQQGCKFYKGIKPTDRIVSMDKSYLRPIVRGKEIKKVEFGAKVHKVQIDGISFIEHMSFSAYNEGTRLKSSIYLAQEYMHAKVKLLGADGIYANNRNRKYVTRKGIKTDFKRKGRRSKHHHHYDQLQKAITKERASRLEGSFGTDKEHFLLNRIKARTELTERLWIFFGIHTSNALKIGRRIAKSSKLAA